MKLKNIYIIILVTFFFSCKSYFERITDSIPITYEIRVKLLLGNEIIIENTRNLKIIDSITNNELKNLKYDKKNKNLTIKIINNQIILNNYINLSFPIYIYSKNSNFIKINNNLYYGTIKIIPNNSNLDVINILPLEIYLLSVVASEVPLTFHIEALKAQAIIARTYSYNFIKKNYQKDFDVDNTTNYQVYNGFNFINNNKNNKSLKNLYRAIKETESKIIKWNNEPIVAYFHSNSGGRTKSGLEYFGSHSDFPYLVARDDPYSINTKGYSWNFEISINEFKEKLNIDPGTDLKTENFIKDNKDFILFLNISTKKFTPKEIRRMIGYRNVKSENFKIEIINDKIVFTGFGYGHGVGLSQWGAQNMALAGFSYIDIIKFYYNGVEISNY